MKLTEQQLAQMFQQSKNIEVESTADEEYDLYNSTDASDKRLADVEAITNNSTLSTSYQVINQLQDWSQAVGTDIQLSLKPNFTASLFAWLRPSIATAAIITTVYFVTPQIDNQMNNPLQAQLKPDQIMFSASFDKKDDTIRTMSFDSKQISIDSISRSNFG